MIPALTFAAILFWLAVLFVLFRALGLSPLDFLLGHPEPLPSNLGVWRAVEQDVKMSLVREERWLLPGDNPTSPHLILQVRHRSVETGKIVSTEPERTVRRRRLRG